MNPMDQYNYNNGYGYYDQNNNNYSYGYDYNNNNLNNDYYNNQVNNYFNYNNYDYNSVPDYTMKYETPTYTPIDTNSWNYNYTNYDSYLNKKEITPIGSTGNSHFGYVKPYVEEPNGWHVSTPLPGFGKKEGFDNGFTWHDNLNDFKY
jgi:hypothetical protein